MLKFVNGEIKQVDEPALTALNMRLRDDYTADCDNGMCAGTRSSTTAGIEHRLYLPHVAFNRQIGEFRDAKATPQGLN